jgi:NAD(P)-dependent dehydrogenase (short-subunit alcohol dehydrogenase family)
MTEELRAQKDADTTIQNTVPLKRMGEPEEVAEMVIWLASDAASYVSGGTFIVSGGMRV